MLLIFGGCSKKNIYVDETGNTHKLIMKNGEPVQDENGNLIEKRSDGKGGKTEAVVYYPEVTEAGKNAIQNAVLKLDIPKDWYFDENVKVFRIHHEDCPGKGKCEFEADIQLHEELDDVYSSKLATWKRFNTVSEEKLVKEIEEFETKLFDIKTKGFKLKYMDDISIYYYAFNYANHVVSFSFFLNDKCFADDFKPEQFIKENVMLKTIPTER